MFGTDKRMSTLALSIVLGISAIGTLFCWLRIVRSNDSRGFKIAGFFISAIPVLGPFIFLVFDMPSSLPEDARAPPRSMGTELYTDITRKLYERRRRYLTRLYSLRRGVRK
jgi:hypothetical protein